MLGVSVWFSGGWMMLFKFDSVTPWLQITLVNHIYRVMCHIRMGRLLSGIELIFQDRELSRIV